ncbi:MAG: YihA family ribosome biogenesis GTP-binding protein [Clostridia bacterium]|nr:YihA family ribosome biogenesis GTP-binding protein [Clostridia bacterium]
MKIKNAEFLISASNKNNFADFSIKEFAFVGRSNCGKSSLINALTNQKKLAKTSSTPGLTKLVNYFLINTNKDAVLKRLNAAQSDNCCMFVDLPGYGYSKAGKQNHELWSGLIEDYFKYSKNLSCVFVLLDSRHAPTNLDKQMIKYLYAVNIPFKIIATKLDKISKNELKNNLKIIANNLKITENNIIAVSAKEKINLNLILDFLDNYFN